MKACTMHNVKRCVVTSSYASIRWTAKEDFPKDNVFDESYWSNPDRPEGMGDYAASKVLAEKAAWDYQASQKNPFELVTILPTLLLGPGIASPNVVSEEFVRCLLLNTKPSIKLASNYYVDVRDVAIAHMNAITVPEAANRRFMLSGEVATKETIREMLIEKYGSIGFNPGCDEFEDLSGGAVNDNSASRKVLRINYRPIEDTILGMADSMIAGGRISPPA